MALSKFPVVSKPHRSRPNDVFLLFKAMIQDGRCRPGERLPNERDLAQHLGVSRPSLREAIRALAAMNILEVRHGDGTYVTSRVHRSTRELEAAIRQYIDLTNSHPKPFVWTKTADDILASVARFCHRISDSGH